MSSYRLPGGGRRRGFVNPLSPPHDAGPAVRRAFVLKLAAVVVVLLVIGALGVAWGYSLQLGRTIAFDDAAQAQLVQAQLTHVPGQPYNVLIAGVEADSDGAPRPTSILILLHVDPQQERAWLLWIPPNTLQLIPDHGSTAIANARTFGGGAGTVKAVKTLTGLKIQQYAEVELGAVQKIVDTVGGVWVNVPASVEDTQSDSSPSHGASKIQTGPQLLDGYHALTFARAQVSAGDRGYGRMQDQQLLLHAMAAAIAGRANSPAALQLLATAAPFIKTTMSLGDLTTLERQLRGAGAARIYEAAVISSATVPTFVPDSEVLARLVGDVRKGVPFDVPSAQLPYAAAKSTAVVAGKKPSDITVTVSNGGGISGAAKQAAGVLQTQGFRITSTGNANLNVYRQTLVIYKKDRSLASLVARYLQPGTKIVRSNGFYTFKTDILVIVGKDWDLAKVPAAQIQTQ